MKGFACSCLLCVLPLYAHEVSLQTGLLRNDIGPSVDFGVATYKHGPYRIGAFTAPDRQGVVASYTSQNSPFLFEIGQREKSLDQGFVIGNGAYLPWTKNFAFGEPMGIRTGYRTRYGSVAGAYYRQDDQNLVSAQLAVFPADWLTISGGAAAQNAETAGQGIPLAALTIGDRGESTGFQGGAEFAGTGNYLLHARYTDGFTLRALGFKRASENPLASGIYGFKEGIAAQFISDSWFAQYFQTDTRFAMLRFAGEYMTAVGVYEEKTQMAGLTLRNSATGLHLRSGATVASDGSLQTLAGLGYGDFIFLGGGHYALYGEQPLEPVIFPSAWYSSLLLQSTAMRIKDRGFKMMALVDTQAVQGFFAVTYAEDARGRERFNFFMRVAGHLSF